MREHDTTSVFNAGVSEHARHEGGGRGRELSPPQSNHQASARTQIWRWVCGCRYKRYRKSLRAECGRSRLSEGRVLAGQAYGLMRFRVRLRVGEIAYVLSWGRRVV